MATAADADLILKLYDLRREDVCRQARAFFIRWKPASAAEVQAVATDFSRQDNAWLRQATSYWEMAFSLANSGAIDGDLFAKNCGEGVIFAIKCQLLKARFPDVWQRTMTEAETFMGANAAMKGRVDGIRKRVEGMMA